MSKELEDFIYFKENQLVSVDFNTGTINVKDKRNKLYKNVGSLNKDGYQRIWCNSTLRMKHRLLYWLYFNELPEEIDHLDHNRNNNNINNLRSVTRKENTKNKTKRIFKHLTKEEIHSLCKDITSNKYSITFLAEKYNKSRVQIKAIIAKKYWTKISDRYF